MKTLGAVLLGTLSWPATGCVPASVDEWSGGRAHDAGTEPPIEGPPQGSTRDAALDATLRPQDAGHDAARAADAKPVVEVETDAASPPAPVPRVDAGTVDVPDAGSVGVPDASPPPPVADAGPAPLCMNNEALCDDFEAPLVCPSARPGKWSSCEQLGSAPDPVVVAGTGRQGRVFFSSLGAATDTRSARVALDLSVNVRRVYAAFDFFPQQLGSNALYTWVKLEQGSGQDVNGDPTHYAGVSLISRGGVLALAVQTTYDLLKPDREEVIEVRAMPAAWTRVALEMAFGATQTDVSLQFDDAAPVAYGPFAPTPVTVETLQFLLGVYSDEPGNGSVLYDNVVVR